MASGSTMAAVNVSDSRDSSLTPPLQERNRTEKSTQQRERQGGPGKNLASPLPAANKRTANQAFHNPSSELVPDSQLQNEVANLERQVLEAKKVVLQRQLQTLTTAKPASLIEEPTVNPKEARASNFGFFYEHKGEKSHLIPLMREYRSVDVQYIRDVKKNKFKPEIL